MRLYHVSPQDVLFFRDARPMASGTGSGGHGARWPEPSVLFDALHAALHRAFPLDGELRRKLDEDSHEWEHAHRSGRSSKRNAEAAREQRFGALTSAGFFPALGGATAPRWLFPSPADVSRAQEGQVCAVLKPLKDRLGASDLPRPLGYSLGNPAMPRKETPAPWWSKLAWESYLRGNPVPEDSLFGRESLFAGEWTTGIGIAPDRAVQDGERIYSAEYMRLRPGVSLGFAAGLPGSRARSGTAAGIDCLDHLFERERVIVVGGQQRCCEVVPVMNRRLDQILPVSSEISGPFIKWVLLTPAVYPPTDDREVSRDGCSGRIPEHPGGWLPNWIDPKDGRVLLRKVEKSERRRRRQLRYEGKLCKSEENSVEVGARLVAARIPKPIVLSGWSERLHLIASGEKERDGSDLRRGASATQLAVPAGAVYYFEAAGATDNEKTANARSLVDMLSWHGAADAPAFGQLIKNRRSTLLGEQGFGLGVCGHWEFYR